jgi:hypothetical protein
MLAFLDRHPRVGRRRRDPLAGFAAASQCACPPTHLNRVNHVGPLERARQLEGLGYLGISLQQPLGLDFQSACNLIS